MFKPCRNIIHSCDWTNNWTDNETTPSKAMENNTMLIELCRIRLCPNKDISKEAMPNMEAMRNRTRP